VAGAPEEYDQTSHAIMLSGSEAALAFTGSRISVYGTISNISEARMSTYTVDNAGAVSATSPQTDAGLYQQLLYQSPQLSEGEHVFFGVYG